VKPFAGWTGIAGVVLLAWALGGESLSGRSGLAMDIGVRGRANAYPSIAASGSFVGVTWAARTTDGVADIYATTSRDGGRSFRAPVRVNRVAGEASVSGEQPPRIVLVARAAGDPSVVVMWTAKSPAGTRLVSARSNDAGQTFGPPNPVPGSEAGGNRGWEAMAVGPRGEVMAIWLDHREVPARPAGAAATGAHHHGAATGQPGADSVARAQLSQIFFASLNRAASPVSIAPGVCYCCKTSLATGTDGRIAAVWRHVYPGNVRDIALALSSDGGRTFSKPVRVSPDNWVLDGCPENGPAVAIDKSNAIHVVWPTLVPGRSPSDHEPAMALFHAMSRDGQHFTPRQQLRTEGVPRHPQIALEAGGTLAVAWDEQLSGSRRIVLARGTVGPKDFVRFSRESISEEAGTYPAIASLADGPIVAWTSGTTDDAFLRVTRYPAPK
jgi:hypothetical protein